MKDNATPPPPDDTLGGRGDGPSPVVQIDKRPRGAPRGNRNRWKHGRYSREARERRAALRAAVNGLLARARRAVTFTDRLIESTADWHARLRAEADALAHKPLTEE